MREQNATRSARRRDTWAGRWTPAVFYALIVVSWFIDGALVGAIDRVWLVVITLPAVGLYMLRARRRNP